MPRERTLLCNLILVLLVVSGLCSRALAQKQSTIAIYSTDVSVSGSGDIAVTLSDSTGKSYTEAVVYEPFSTTASIASDLADMFTCSYICPTAGSCTGGLGANAGVNSTAPNVVTLQLNSGAGFGARPIVTNPSDAFSFSAPGWSFNGSGELIQISNGEQA